MFGRSRPPLRDYRAGRIALLKPSALGDIVHSLPVLTALRRRYPQAHLTWVVNRSYEPLLRVLPGRAAPAPLRPGRRPAGPVPQRADGGGDRGGPARRPEHGPRGGAL